MIDVTKILFDTDFIYEKPTVQEFKPYELTETLNVGIQYTDVSPANDSSFFAESNFESSTVKKDSTECCLGKPFPLDISSRLENLNILQIKDFGVQFISGKCAALRLDLEPFADSKTAVPYLHKFDLESYFPNKSYFEHIHPEYSQRVKYKTAIAVAEQRLKRVQGAWERYSCASAQLSFDIGDEPATASIKNEKAECFSKQVDVAQEAYKKLLREFFEFEYSNLQRMAEPAYGRRKIVSLLLSDLLDKTCREKLIGGTTGKKYASDAMVNLFKMLEDYNRQYLESYGLLVPSGSDSEKTISLAEVTRSPLATISDKYCKARGLENLAAELGYTWIFATATCPPEYHPNPTKGKNTWSPTTNIRSAHIYLTEHYAAFVKDLSRKDIRLSDGEIFGMRVVEPHKDGCPHWHLVLFCKPTDKTVVTELLRQHFGSSPKSLDLKFEDKTAVRGNRNRFSPVNYCLKYMMKTFSGIADIAANDVDVGALPKSLRDDARIRISAWKKAIRIRAISFLGIRAQSGLWDALRRLCFQKGCVLTPQDSPRKLDINKLSSILQSHNTVTGDLDNQLRLDFVTKPETSVTNEDGVNAPDTADADIQLAIELARCAVENDFHNFLKASKKTSVMLIKQFYTKPNTQKSVSKVVGISIGKKEFLFKRYEIISVKSQFLENHALPDEMISAACANESAFDKGKKIYIERKFRIINSSLKKYK